MSSVISPGLSESGASWIETERNLLNVAVSRARRALIVLGHPQVGEFGSPTLASLRAYLHELVGRQGSAASPPVVARADSKSEELLLRAMQDQDLLPYHKLKVEGYDLDFALREQGIKLNIEVDGDQRFDGQSGTRRQNITRDRILFMLGWEVLRVPAWRCHIEIESVIDDIRATRDRLLRGVSPGVPAHGSRPLKSLKASVAVDHARSRRANAQLLTPTGTTRNESEETEPEDEISIEESKNNRRIKRAALAAVLIGILIVGGNILSRVQVGGPGRFCPAGVAWNQASEFVGQQGTFLGEVVEVTYVEEFTSQPTFINIGQPFPDPARLTVVVWGRDRDRFPQPPEVAYAAGQEICVSGEVSLFEGIAQIEINSPSAVSVR